MTEIEAKVKEINSLKRLASTIDGYKIHYSEMTSWNRSNREGVNAGLDISIKLIKNKIKRIQKTIVYET